MFVSRYGNTFFRNAQAGVYACNLSRDHRFWRDARSLVPASVAFATGRSSGRGERPVPRKSSWAARGKERRGEVCGPPSRHKDGVCKHLHAPVSLLFSLLAANLPSPLGQSHANLPGYTRPTPSYVCNVQRFMAHSPSCPPKSVEFPGLGRMHVHPDDEETIKRCPSHPPSLHLETRIPSPVHSTWIRSDDAYAMCQIILAFHPLNPHFLNPLPPHAPSPCR